MKKKIAEKWVKALRSGDYKQGKYRLRDEQNNFCCLGVLCNLHAQEHPYLAKLEKYPSSYLAETAELPVLVQEWVGMYDSLGCFSDPVPGYEDAYSLAELNDSGMEFKKLAKYIEKNYKFL